MILKVIIIGFLVGVIGIGLGGVILVIFKREVDKYLSFFMGLFGGIMLVVVVFDLMKEFMDKMGIINIVIFMFVGVFIIMYIKIKLDVFGNMVFGYFIFISILLYNLLEGLVIGFFFMLIESLGIIFVIVIGLYNILEGLVMVLGLVCNKMKLSKVILFIVIVGLFMGLGSFLGVYFGGVFIFFIGVFFVIVGGIMMYVVLEEIFLYLKSVYCIIGFLLGIMIVNYI